MIFSKLRGRAEIVNLNEEARRHINQYSELRANEAWKNAKFISEIFAEIIQKMHQRLGCDWSYGGWMENRDVLLGGSYLRKDKAFMHLGIDLNVPAETAVCAPHEAKVLIVDNDADPEIGWGHRVILDPVDEKIPIIICGHLAAAIRCKVGDMIQSFEDFAEVGRPKENGNVFPHLHIQAIQREHFFMLLNDKRLKDLDGYGMKENRAALEAIYPDPTPIIGLAVGPAKNI